MTYEATNFGLRIAAFEGGEWAELKLTESLTWGWKLFEIFFVKRLSYKDKTSTTWRYVMT